MAVEGINIDLSLVAQAENNIRRINTVLDQKLKEISKEMNELSQSWTSDASETIRGNFNALKPRFEEYFKIVDSYANFLKETVRIYGETETKINTNASAFK